MFEPAIVLEAAMSHPAIVLAMIFGFVLLLSFLLAEKPHVQPANEEHGLTPGVDGKSTSGGDLPSFPGGTLERKKAGEISPAQVIAPVELPAPMNGAEALLMPLVSQFSEMQRHMFEQFQQTLLMMAQMFGNLQREQMALIRQELEQIRELTRQLHTLQSEGAARAAMPLPATAQAAAPSSPMPSRSSTPAASAAKADTLSPKFCDPSVHVWLSQRLSALQQERQNRWQKVLSLVTGK
jgi:hypothetical protein